MFSGAPLMDDEDIEDLPPERAVQLPQALKDAWFKRKADDYDPKRREDEERQTAAAYHREQVKIVRDRMGLGEQSARRPNGADDEGENVVLPQISV
jgi:hypothetical protein